MNISYEKDKKTKSIQNNPDYSVYFATMDRHTDNKVPHKSTGTQHTSLWDICIFFHYSEGSLCADLSDCHLCITNSLFPRCLTPPQPIKNPVAQWRGGWHTGSCCHCHSTQANDI